MDGDASDFDADLPDDADTSGSAPVDEIPADFVDASLEALSADARSITGTSEPELDDLGSLGDWGNLGVEALEARLRLSPAAVSAPVSAPVSGPVAPVLAQVVSVPTPADPTPRVPPELEGSVRALAEQQRLQAQELAELRHKTLRQSAPSSGMDQTAFLAAQKLQRAEADARGARQDAVAQSRRAQVLEEKWAS